MYCFKIFYTLKPSTRIKIDFKNYSNMFRSHWTIIREHVVPIPKLPLISVDKKNQLDVTFCILYFSSNSCSTCFGQPCAHHQELTTA